MSPSERAGIELVTLGMCAGGEDHPVVRRLLQLVSVDAQAGVLSESDFGHRALSEVAPLRDIFAALFFASLGMLTDPMFVVDNYVNVLRLQYPYEFDEYALGTDGSLVVALRVDEAEVEARSSLADPPRRKAHALLGQPIDRLGKIVDP